MIWSKMGSTPNANNKLDQANIPVDDKATTPDAGIVQASM